jgi:hypothetical protein
VHQRAESAANPADFSGSAIIKSMQQSATHRAFIIAARAAAAAAAPAA